MDTRLERARLNWTRSANSHTGPRHIERRIEGRTHVSTRPCSKLFKRFFLHQRGRPHMSKDKKLAKHEHHANSAEEGDTANIKQNTTNEGYFRGRQEILVVHRFLESRGICDACRNHRCTPDNHA